jgi:hypothetical protein
MPRHESRLRLARKRRSDVDCAIHAGGPIESEMTDCSSLNMYIHDDHFDKIWTGLDQTIARSFCLTYGILYSISFLQKTDAKRAWMHSRRLQVWYRSWWEQLLTRCPESQRRPTFTYTYITCKRVASAPGRATKMTPNGDPSFLNLNGAAH